MIITLTGLPGSGKSTLAKLLADHFHIPWYSMGDLRGKMAKDRNMTIDELNALGETEAFTDKEVDEYQTTLGQSKESFVIDGRLSWHFIPESFKIFLDVDPDIGAKRIFDAACAGERSDEEMYTSAEETKEMIQKRIASDKTRYQAYYQVDFMDKSKYDLVIDTSHKSAEESLKEVLAHLPS